MNVSDDFGRVLNEIFPDQAVTSLIKDYDFDKVDDLYQRGRKELHPYNASLLLDG